MRTFFTLVIGVVFSLSAISTENSLPHQFGAEKIHVFSQSSKPFYLSCHLCKKEIGHSVTSDEYIEHLLNEHADSHIKILKITEKNGLNSHWQVKFSYKR
ncbi:MAG: hypothetical protein KC505_10840 [Myxococcales bacterium]|nr:hypothetical protein [Myxococcales bacterium]USN51537.1 MAG: hypothetical protein H6731_03780 [Myxococcales bacterium]